MPPEVQHQAAVCWDDLDVWTQAKLIAYEQTKMHDENPPPPKPKPTAAPKRRRRR